MPLLFVMSKNINVLIEVLKPVFFKNG